MHHHIHTHREMYRINCVPASLPASFHIASPHVRMCCILPMTAGCERYALVLCTIIVQVHLAIYIFPSYFCVFEIVCACITNYTLRNDGVFALCVVYEYSCPTRRNQCGEGGDRNIGDFNRCQCSIQIVLAADPLFCRRICVLRI